MAPLDSGLVFWLLAALHLLGLASMFLSRLPLSHRRHGLCQHLFLACLVFVGLATIGTICFQHNGWVWSGTTFSLMAVGATVELGNAARATGI
jgi:hypothetical protein